MTAFHNNLQRGDRVLDTASGRQGTVQMNPRANSVNVSVLFDGLTAQRYVPVAGLRLIVDGKPEDVPPVDGEVPEAADQEVADRQVEDDHQKWSEQDRHHLALFAAAARVSVQHQSRAWIVSQSFDEAESMLAELKRRTL